SDCRSAFAAPNGIVVKTSSSKHARRRMTALMTGSLREMKRGSRSRAELDQKAWWFSMLRPHVAIFAFDFGVFWAERSKHRYITTNLPVSDRHHPDIFQTCAVCLAAVRRTPGRQCPGAGTGGDAGLAIRSQTAALAAGLRC